MQSPLFFLRVSLAVFVTFTLCREIPSRHFSPSLLILRDLTVERVIADHGNGLKDALAKLLRACEIEGCDGVLARSR